MLLFGSLLGYGLISGRMPAKSAFYDKKESPRYFWLTGAMYAAAVGYCVYEIIKLSIGGNPA